MKSAWLLNHQRAIAQALGRLLRAPLATLFTLLVIGLSICVPSILYLGLKNLDQWLGHLPVHAEISVFTQTDDNSALQQLNQQLQQLPQVTTVRLIRREEALTDLAQKLGVNDLAAGLPRNPLAHTLIVSLDSATQPHLFAQLQQDIAKLPNVTAVQYDASLNEKLHALRAFATNAAWAIAILLAIALATVIANTIRLQILTQRDEIEVSKLIGATDAYIRRPFMYFGLLQGLFGGLMALLLLAILAGLTAPYLTQLLQGYGPGIELYSLNSREALLILGIPALLGALSAHLAASLHLQALRPN